MKSYLRADRLQAYDVITVKGMDVTVIGVDKYRRKKRKWVNITYTFPTGGVYSSQQDVAVPAEAMVPWLGSSLF